MDSSSLRAGKRAVRGTTKLWGSRREKTADGPAPTSILYQTVTGLLSAAFLKPVIQRFQITVFNTLVAPLTKKEHTRTGVVQSALIGQ